MAILEVQHLQKVYTTRFGGAQVEALRDVMEANDFWPCLEQQRGGKPKRG